MMEGLLSEYKALGHLHEIFKSYLKDKDKYEPDKIVTKPQVFQMFFDYTLLDTCGVNIFDLNNLLYELAAFEKGITMEHFLRLVFHIYSSNKEKTESNISKCTLETISSLFTSTKHDYNFETSSIVNLLEQKYTDRQIFYYFMKPDISFKEIENITNYSNLKKVEKYAKALYDNLFVNYASRNKHNVSMDVLSISVFELNKYILDKNIISNFNSTQIGHIMKHFFLAETDINAVIDEKNDAHFTAVDDCQEHFAQFCKLFEDKKKEREIKEIFNGFIYPYDYININFSSFVLMMALFATSLESSKGKDFEEQIKFFFEEILKIKPDNYVKADNEDEDNKKEDIEDDYLPESDNLKKVKLRLPKTTDDVDFMLDFLNFLNQLLPEPDESILNFMNDEEVHADNYSFYQEKKKRRVAKFPVEELMIEKEEAREKLQKEKEDKQILLAAKPKKNQKDKVQNPYNMEMEDKPDIEKHDLKYFGREKVEALTHRLLKHTMKEILPNSHVFPSLIKEVLMIPKKINDKALEVVVQSLKDQVTGHLEQAIKRLETSRTHLSKADLEDSQVDLFYQLSFGSLYESLDYDLEAIKYYYHAFSAAKNLMPIDPDTALVYCYLGEIFVKLKEFVWALRSFLKAKKIREDTIGGDTPDTATIYNNLGVVCYMMKSYLPANGYFKLAYEIYRETCGLTHPRTMMIKANLGKMSNLEFNKEVEFKTLSYIPLPAFFAKNDKKKGGK